MHTYSMGVALRLEVRPTSEGLLVVLLSCQRLVRPHWHARMMECARRRSGCRLPWTAVPRWRACTSRTFALMRAKRTRRWFISRRISPGMFCREVAGVLGATKIGARAIRCSRVEAAALRGFEAQIIQRWPHREGVDGPVCRRVGTKTCVVSSGSGGGKLSRTASRRTRAAQICWRSYGNKGCTCFTSLPKVLGREGKVRRVQIFLAFWEPFEEGVRIVCFCLNMTKDLSVSYG